MRAGWGARLKDNGEAGIGARRRPPPFGNVQRLAAASPTRTNAGQSDWS
jgi:hypothetical protein